MTQASDSTKPLRYAVVGSGRLGHALVKALPWLDGPFGRGFDGAGYDVVLLAVPDAQIQVAAARIPNHVLVGHCSGATTLDVLAPHECFSVHPLMTITPDGAVFRGAGAAVAGSSELALAVATHMATALGMTTVHIADVDRAAYHAAASIAANFLITLEDAAEALLTTTGAARAILVPLARAALENWAISGSAALTGPIARGDHQTVARQRAAIAERLPELLALFDVLAERTTTIATRS